jgi:hypothetical protein
MILSEAIEAKNTIISHLFPINEIWLDLAEK